ncbi:MAG TPA: DUF87 domain-containing protein [Chloroflexus aurantiacus]|jgi:hypothetical protein|uniref:Helicase HerA central domain-containing protein n=1 Tax=Chloroflexus aurantiacus (strain ATCC 29366 / DSM 635 / J-10-fl) TaxID=324602 RepID=A9WFM2_CHLAA|nr:MULTISPECIES: DUF87 domain-containing protein [Chloroflexus]ABY33960.1 conserved hypothetical protein [Chloroflexus aurantiacus J-10-fl]GIV93813.1 MAG: hypothetical protein KatS3mg056_2522 [Chloroflexus sp.]HBW68866.1 DUF87 domain-containing protein [Chloroflexus aurantiacus]
MQNVNSILKKSPLAELLQSENFVGWVYAIDYEFAYVMTNDLWKYKALGIPHNCFLVAASFDPQNLTQASEDEMEVILLRVLGSAKLPQDDDLVRTKIDHFKDQKSPMGTDRELDDITRSEMQFSGLKCRVLGTFFVDQDELWLGSDLESFATATRLNVYRPHGKALETIVNYVDPIRRNAAREMAEQLGLKGEIKPFQIGTVRYTSTDRLHRRAVRAEKVPVFVQPADFLGRRTAVLGMTRTGKSNMIKQMVSVVKRVADASQARIGQIIYDINGEYANANQQDKGALADIYPKDTVRYRMLEAEGFRELRTNFYEQLNEGFGIIQRELEEANRVTTDYVRAFVNLSLDEPDKGEFSEYKRWQVRVAAYKTLLYVAGFEPPANLKVRFDASKEIRTSVNSKAGENLPDPSQGLTLEQAKKWFLALRLANQESSLKSSSGNGKDWVDDALQTLINMIAQRQGNTYISGHRILTDAIKYHSPNRTSEVADEIYELLRDGKIVILDLSVGDARIREKVSTRIAQKIFQNSMQIFVEGRTPPNIVVYIEEAHNLIGKGMDLTETWPRLAKEGAKYRISLVYATQEVSSMHPNILANTENWFITHLNNAREVKELSQFYDFEDFGDSLIRAQDVGFARVKMLSSPFVIPVQIDKFDPEAERQRMAANQE